MLPFSAVSTMNCFAYEAIFPVKDVVEYPTF